MFSESVVSRRALLQGLCASAAFGATGATKVFAAESTLARARRLGSLVVGIANERPYAFVDTDGRLRGAIPDLLLAVLSSQGIKSLEARVVDFNALIPGLNAGRFDVIGAGMYIRPARCLAISFSNPITQTGGGLVARKASPIEARSLDDLARMTTIKVGTQSGSSQVERLTKAGVPRERMVLFTRIDEAVAGLQAKRCDVIYFPALQVNEILNLYKDSTLVRVPRFETELNYQGFGVRNHDEDLRAAINGGIAARIADGGLLKIIQAYGYGESEVPNPKMTADKICAG